MDDQDALRVLGASFGVVRPTLVGTGQEGFVFSDGTKQYKVFRHGGGSLPQNQREFLLRALGKGSKVPKRILSVSEIREVGDNLVVVSPLVSGVRYNGGRWWDLVELLRECRARGIAITNIHPDNLLSTESGLIFVDLGASIVPLSEPYWDQMVNRAYLSFRWPSRHDLRELMRRSIIEDLPELEGAFLLRHDVGPEAPELTPPIGARAKGPAMDVTLMIKTCLMEWATIEFQVEHLVKQLEGPSRFHETLVVSDWNLGPFARGYDKADPRRTAGLWVDSSATERSTGS